jgi:hypothetical protein
MVAAIYFLLAQYAQLILWFLAFAVLVAIAQNGEEGLWYLASSYTSEIGYSYSVEGTYYAGHLTKTFFREESARRFVERLKSRDVIVRYSPTSSRISRLCREDQTEISFS